MIASEARTPDGWTYSIKAPGEGSPAQDLAQDRAFWRDLLAGARGGGLPAHSAGGYRNRRFAIIRDAAWITLYRAKLPFPQVGVFLRCTGLAGEAFFALADHARAQIEPRLRAKIGPERCWNGAPPTTLG